MYRPSMAYMYIGCSSIEKVKVETPAAEMRSQLTYLAAGSTSNTSVGPWEGVQPANRPGGTAEKLCGKGPWAAAVVGGRHLTFSQLSFFEPCNNIIFHVANIPNVR